jgi:hypothetical protein
MSNKKNNPFADLEKNHSREFREGSGHHNVQRGLDSTLGTARMLGSIADVYLSRFMGTVMSMAGSKENQTKPGEGGGRRENQPSKHKYPNL